MLVMSILIDCVVLGFAVEMAVEWESLLFGLSCLCFLFSYIFIHLRYHYCIFIKYLIFMEIMS